MGRHEEPRRREFLTYLREDFGYGKDFGGSSGPFAHHEVEEALRLFARTDPSSWSILHTWMTTRMDQNNLSKTCHWGSHSLKRRLNACADALVVRLKTRAYAPVDSDRTVRSECETFREVLLHALERAHPGIEEQVTQAMKMAHRDQLGQLK